VFRAHDNRVHNGSHRIALGLLLALAVSGSCSNSPAKEQARRRPAKAPANASPVAVLVSRSTVGAKVRYSYRIANGSAFPIANIKVGFDRDNAVSQILNVPGGWQSAVPPESSCTSPTGWTIQFVSVEGDSAGFYEWDTDDPAKMVPGGQSLSGFSVAMDKFDNTYEQGSWTAYTTSEDAPYFTGPIERDPTSGVDPGGVSFSKRIVIDSNPGGGGMKARLSLERDEPFSATIFDVQGRVVRKLAVPSKGHAGQNAIAWDGLTANGAKAASGTYFLRIRTKTDDLYARFVILR
jgi:hypothetical protein